jgi:hypothetical protein
VVPWCVPRERHEALDVTSKPRGHTGDGSHWAVVPLIFSS